MALTNACQEATWLKRLLSCLSRQEEKTVLIAEDNQSCIALSRNPRYHGRTKHISIRHHFVRNLVESGEVSVEYCPTEDMIADVLTKPLNKQKHYYLRRKMQVLNSSEVLDDGGVLKKYYHHQDERYEEGNSPKKRMNEVRKLFRDHPS